jgi:exodeoxyribonuclease V beta subunit
MLAMQETFRDCGEHLRERGVQPMFRLLFRRLDVPTRALAMADGERLLTDALHLVELLALARATLDSDEALLAHFAACVANADGEREEQQLRLESDAQRVRILTIHASKGLEFPVVVLPFPFQRRTQGTPLFHDMQTWRPVYDLANDPASLKLAEQERLSEDLRLLYVALTRAQHSCVIGVGDVTDHKNSILAQTALGWLLGADAMPPEDALQRLLAIPGAQMIGVPSPAALPAPAALQKTLLARELVREPERYWRSTSYSALASHKAEPDRAEQVFRQPELYASAGPGDAEPERNPFGFPRGPEYGDMLHKVLERADVAQPAALPGNAEAIRAALAGIGLADDWHPVVAQMFDDLRECPLDGRALRLCDIARNQRISEMRFELPVQKLDAAAVNALMRAHEPIARQASDLAFKTAHGLLTGAIDLVFCHQGRYFVADYKSNHLGNTLADYGTEQQETVIAEHRYDLQYTLYTVALVRYLRARLGPAFDYDTHVGGVFYLFLRGIRGSNASGQGIFFRRPAKALIEGLDQMLGTGAP